MKNPYQHAEFPKGIYPYPDMTAMQAVNDKSYLHSLGIDSLVLLYRDLNKAPTNAEHSPSAGQLGKTREAFRDYVQDLSRELFRKHKGHPNKADIFSTPNISVSEANRYIGEFNAIFVDNLNTKTSKKEYEFPQTHQENYLRHEEKFYQAPVTPDLNKKEKALNPRFRGISELAEPVAPVLPPRKLNPAWFIPLAILPSTCDDPPTPVPPEPVITDPHVLKEINYLEITNDARLRDNAIKMSNPELAADAVVAPEIIKKSIKQLSGNRFDDESALREDFSFRYQSGLLPESLYKNFKGHAYSPQYNIDTRLVSDPEKALADLNTFYAYFPKLVGEYYKAVLAAKTPSENAERKMQMAIERTSLSQQKWAEKAPDSPQNNYYKSQIKADTIVFTSDCNLILENYQEAPLNVTHKTTPDSAKYPGDVVKCFENVTEAGTHYCYGTVNNERLKKTFPGFTDILKQQRQSQTK